MTPVMLGRRCCFQVTAMPELQLVSKQAPNVVEPLCLSERQHRAESVLAYCVAIEHIRVAQPSDPRTTAMYCARVLDNCRVSAVDVRAYFSGVV
jgi:hypothetical protein